MLRGGLMRGSPSVTSVGSGSSATLTAPPETSLMRSVLLLHTVRLVLLSAVTCQEWILARSGYLYGVPTQCVTSALNHCLLLYCNPYILYGFVKTGILKSDCLALLQ